MKDSDFSKTMDSYVDNNFTKGKKIIIKFHYKIRIKSIYIKIL